MAGAGAGRMLRRRPERRPLTSGVESAGLVHPRLAGCGLSSHPSATAQVLPGLRPATRPICGYVLPRTAKGGSLLLSWPYLLRAVPAAAAGTSAGVPGQDSGAHGAPGPSGGEVKGGQDGGGVPVGLGAPGQPGAQDSRGGQVQAAVAGVQAAGPQPPGWQAVCQVQRVGGGHAARLPTGRSGRRRAGVQPGERVYASLFPAGGGFAELALASADRLAPIPGQASFAEAAGLVIAGGTAHEDQADDQT